MEIPSLTKPVTGNELLRKRIDQVEKGYTMLKGEFVEHGHEMDTYALQEQEESIEDWKLQL